MKNLLIFLAFGAIVPAAQADETFVLDLASYRDVQDEIIPIKRELIRQHDIDPNEFILLEVRLTARSADGRGRATLTLGADEPGDLHPYVRFGRSWTTRSYLNNEDEASEGAWRIVSEGDFDFLEAEVVLEEGTPVRNCRKYGELAEDVVLESHRYQRWELDLAADVCTSTALAAFKEVRRRGFHEWSLRDATQVDTRWALRAFRRAISGPVYFEWQTRWSTAINNRWSWKSFDLVADGQYWEWELRWSSEVHTEREWNAVERLYSRGRYTELELRRAARLDD